MDTTTTATAAVADTGRHVPLDVLVIGAGQAGLALAWHLSRRHLRHLVVDSAPEVGHVWRSRWDSLTLFSPAQYDGLPGTPFPAPADTYPGKDQVADFLASYAEQHALPVLTGTRVVRLAPHPDGFAAHTTQGALHARQVVVATGPFQQPRVPALSAGFDGIPQLHSAGYRRPSDLPTGRVLVVGGGNSGLQIARELAATHDVVLSNGATPPSLPQRLAGHDLFWWLARLGLMDKGPDSRLARRVRARGDVVIGTSRRTLRRAGVDLRPRLVGADGKAARFADGSSAPVDGVVWATGFRPDYSWIEAPATDRDGAPLHEGGRSCTVPGLWFLGLPWQRSRGSALLGFVQRDAERLAAQLASRAHVS
ncbi:MAG TPA: FAD-dependent oxidoreductase [Segeticoccus sp.]|nr:FAD-dependent oxidoreductase [Segeticoccus sp.]